MEMIEAFLYIGATVLLLPAVIMMGIALGLALIEGVLTVWLWPWRNRD